MSYDLVILEPVPNMTVGYIEDGYERMVDQGQAYPFGKPTQALQNCAEEIWKLFPPFSELNEAEIEDSVWAGDITPADGHLEVTLRLSVEQPVIDKIVSIAHDHGLAVFDLPLNDFHPMKSNG